MTADQYHTVLVPLRAAEQHFERAKADWSLEDERLLYSLQLLKAELLRRESGHPFPALTPNWGPDDKPVRVLIVDDEPAICALVQLALGSQSDIEVVGSASNGRLAVEQALALNPDVILMDLNMPVVDGITAIRCLRNLQLTAKIVVHTGNTDAVYIDAALNAGAVAYLAKPASALALTDIVRSFSRNPQRVFEP